MIADNTNQGFVQLKLFVDGRVGSEPQEERVIESDLERIFRLQRELNDYIAEKKGIDFYSDPDKWINNWINAIIAESCELRDETNWKWWKNPKELDMDAIKEEVIDIWHFLVSLSQVVGLTPQELLEVYEKKNQINRDRQDGKTDKEGYA